MDRDKILIGRSSTCEIRLRDPYVSRRQAQLVQDGARFTLRNLGKNAILVNGVATEQCILGHRDIVVLGKTELIFELEPSAGMESDQGLFHDPDLAEDTVLMAQPLPGEDLGPGLMISTPDGRVRTYRLEQMITTIGRAEDADLTLADPVISREQCAIEQRRDGYYLVNRSRTNPTLVNDREIEEKRLVSGDMLKVGTHLLSFFSDRPEDIRPVHEKIIRQSGTLVRAILVGAILLTLGLTGYVATHKIYRPWKWRQQIDESSRAVESGAIEQAQATLSAILKNPLPADLAERAGGLLAETTVMLAQNMTGQGEPDRAKQFLSDYLKIYGAGEAAGIVWDQLNSTRMRVAGRLENEGRYLEAIREYSSIWEDSPVYPDAQKAISRLWLEAQQKNVRQPQQPPPESQQPQQDVLQEPPQDTGPQQESETIARLLEAADRHFQVRHYLTPMNGNAYVIYREVLSMDPNNAVALGRIQEMLDFYKAVGEKYVAAGNYSKAATYFERYLLIEPEHATVKKRLALCRAKRRETGSKPQTASGRTAPASRPPAAAASDQQAQQQKVKRLLEESGTDASWVMQYLFGKEGEKTDPNSPW